MYFGIKYRIFILCTVFLTYTCEMIFILITFSLIICRKSKIKCKMIFSVDYDGKRLINDSIRKLFSLMYLESFFSEKKEKKREEQKSKFIHQQRYAITQKPIYQSCSLF